MINADEEIHDENINLAEVAADGSLVNLSASNSNANEELKSKVAITGSKLWNFGSISIHDSLIYIHNFISIYF